MTGDEEDARAVAVLAALSPRSPLVPGEPRIEVLDAPLARFDAAWHGGPGARRDALAERAAAAAEPRVVHLVTNSRALHSAAAHSLVGETARTERPGRRARVPAEHDNAGQPRLAPAGAALG